MTQRFTEFFPILCPIPPLSAFRLEGLQAGDLVGPRIAQRLEAALGGHWRWGEGVLLTDAPVAPVQVEITLDMLYTHEPTLFTGVSGMLEDAACAAAPRTRALFALQTALPPHHDALQTTVQRMTTTLGSARILCTPRLQPWQIGDDPALSIALSWHAVHECDLYAHMSQHKEKVKHYIGWPVFIASEQQFGTITATEGILSRQRVKLLQNVVNPALRQQIEASPDACVVFRVRRADGDRPYPATCLQAVLHPDNCDLLAQLSIDPAQLQHALNPTPAARAAHIKAITERLKQHGIIGSSFSTQSHPACFSQPDQLPDIRVGGGRTRSFPLTLSERLCQPILAPLMSDHPLRTGIITLLDMMLVDDFMEAMRRQLERSAQLTLDVLRPQRLPDLNATTLAGAVRLLDKHSPELVLLFVPDAAAHSPHLTRALRTLRTQQRGVLLVTEGDLNDPDQMPRLINQLQTVCGAQPFAYAWPLDGVDVVVGLTLTRHASADADLLRGHTALFHADGVPLAQHEADIEVDAGEDAPLVLLQRLLPEAPLARKRTLIHYAGALPDGTRAALRKWARLLNAPMTLVEIHTADVPWLYQAANGIHAADWGTTFTLNAHEALISTSQGKDRPSSSLLIRCVEGKLSVEQAALSVLLWAALPYECPTEGTLPATLRAPFWIQSHLVAHP
jgi:hypothetical protein